MSIDDTTIVFSYSPSPKVTEPLEGDMVNLDVSSASTVKSTVRLVSVYAPRDKVIVSSPPSSPIDVAASFSI